MIICTIEIVGSVLGVDKVIESTSKEGILSCKRLSPFLTLLSLACHHYENTPVRVYWKFYLQNWKFSDKNSDIFHISAKT